MVTRFCRLHGLVICSSCFVLTRHSMAGNVIKIFTSQSSLCLGNPSWCLMCFQVLVCAHVTVFLTTGHLFFSTAIPIKPQRDCLRVPRFAVFRFYRMCLYTTTRTWLRHKDTRLGCRKTSLIALTSRSLLVPPHPFGQLSIRCRFLSGETGMGYRTPLLLLGYAIDT